MRLRHRFQHARREQREEVRAEAVPVHLAQARDGGAHRHAGDVEGQRVAELQAQRLRDALLHRDAGRRTRGAVEPFAGDDAIGRRQLGRPRQVELALGEPSRPRVGVLGGVEPRAVDLDQPAADHRIEGRVRARHRLQRGAHAVDLVGEHVDDEMVRRIRRQARAPVLHQVAAHDGEQQQRHEPERQRADLQARGERAAAQVRESEAPGRAALGQALQQQDQDPGRERRGGEQRADAADHDRACLRILRLPGDQERDDPRAQQVGDDPAGSRSRQVAAQHAQRRHARERDQRRQGKAEQQQNARAECRDRRQKSRARQFGGRHGRQEFDQQLLTRERDARCRQRSRGRRAPRTAARTARAPAAAARPGSGASPRCRDGGADSATRRARSRPRQGSPPPAPRARGTAPRARASAALRAAGRARFPCADRASARSAATRGRDRARRAPTRSATRRR